MSAGCKAAVDTWGLDFFFFFNFLNFFSPSSWCAGWKIFTVLMCQSIMMWQTHKLIWENLPNTYQLVKSRWLLCLRRVGLRLSNERLHNPLPFHSSGTETLYQDHWQYDLVIFTFLQCLLWSSLIFVVLWSWSKSSTTLNPMDNELAALSPNCESYWL